MVSGGMKNRGAPIGSDLAAGPAEATKQIQAEKTPMVMGYSIGLYPSQQWENEVSEVRTTLFFSINLNIS